MNQMGYLRSLGGRRICKDGYPYQWVNKLIQGSGADMTNKVVGQLYRDGIIPYAVIHDSIEFGSEDFELVQHVGEVMRSVYDTRVPFVSDVKMGDNWGSLKKVEEVL